MAHFGASRHSKIALGNRRVVKAVKYSDIHRKKVCTFFVACRWATVKYVTLAHNLGEWRIGSSRILEKCVVMRGRELYIQLKNVTLVETLSRLCTVGHYVSTFQCRTSNERQDPAPRYKLTTAGVSCKDWNVGVSPPTNPSRSFHR